MKRIILTLLVWFLCFGGMLFDGADDKIPCGDVAPFSGSTASWSFWIKPISQTSGDTIWDKLIGTYNGSTVYWRSGDEIALFIGNDANFMGWQTDAANFSNGVLYHVVILYVEDSSAEFYVNGVFKACSVISNGGDNGIADIAQPAIIGANNAASTYSEGTITELALWNTSLTPSEIESLASGKAMLPLQIQASSLVGYWPLIEVGEGVSGDGATFLNYKTPGTYNGVGDDGAGNSGLTGTASERLTY